VTRSQLLKKRNSEGGREELPFMTANDLLRSGVAGMWKDRTDIRSTATFARRLREGLAKRCPR
jgi:hypothetical protein